MALMAGFDITTAVGAQLDLIGKFMGVKRQGFDFSGAVVLSDTEFRAYLAIVAKRNAILGIASSQPAEVFTVTAWGAVPTVSQLTSDFPNLLTEACQLERLEEKLSRWIGG